MMDPVLLPPACLASSSLGVDNAECMTACSNTHINKIVMTLKGYNLDMKRNGVKYDI